MTKNFVNLKIRKCVSVGRGDIRSETFLCLNVIGANSRRLYTTGVIVSLAETTQLPHLKIFTDTFFIYASGRNFKGLNRAGTR